VTAGTTPAAEAAAPGAGPPFPYALLATDLDGTLLRSDGSVSLRTRAALDAACARGAAHLVVTGRSVPWTVPVLEDLNYTGLAVCGQGAQLYDAGARRLLTSVTLDRRVARTALARVEARTGPLLLAASRDGLDGEVLVGPGFRDQGGGLPAAHVEDPGALWELPLNKLYLQHPALSDDARAAAARAAAGDLVGIVLSGEGVVEMLPLGLDKSRGLSMAARRLGATAAGTLAFGDMPNDVPMLAWAGHGVAMGGAHPDLLAVADEVTASPDDDGIALVLEKLLAG
jgi:HAD superfamily hydrolase (TIGR01484 family)